MSIILSKHLRNVNAGFVELAAVACDGGEIGGANATTATACRRGCLIRASADVAATVVAYKCMEPITNQFHRRDKAS